MEIYAAQYIAFKSENRYVINMINRGVQNLDYNRHDFQAVIEVFDKLNMLHNELLKAAAVNSRLMGDGKRVNKRS